MRHLERDILLDHLLVQLPDYYNLADREIVERAYRVAEEAHHEQKRQSGKPYITHCLEVASILAEMRAPSEVVAAGLLHDTVEDTTITLQYLREEFGDTIANLVDGVTKLTNLPRVSRGDQHMHHSEDGANSISAEQEAKRRKQQLASETLRKTFLAMGEDVRVVLIKLADRLHNMRTLSAVPEEKRRRIARETLDIFAPLANRLGIWHMKWELEDLGFQYSNPQKYEEIANELNHEEQSERQAQIEAIKDNLVRLLRKNNVQVTEISGRPKHIYSIYRKMTQKNKPFDLVRDVRAVRILVPDVPACYATLGVIHTTWRPIPGEFDDYIAAPKDNFYQSLHTAVIYDDKRPLEVQIRTPEMHQNAEYGIAAHWRYKEGSRSSDKVFEERIKWLRSMMDWRTDVSDANEFVEGMKTDVFRDRVYVFTPRGDIIDLSAGSTPIDFAYHVHTDIGHRCRGARVNGKLVPLHQELKTGDQVEILTAKRGGPSRDWLNSNLGLVKTQRARGKIKAWFKKQEDEQNLAQGRATLERELQRLGIPEMNFDGLANEMGYKTADEFFIALGCGDLPTSRVIRRLSENAETTDILTPGGALPKSRSTGVIEVVGLKGLLSQMAKCCNPAPGDQIVGYITRGRGATIHRQDCPNMLRMKDKERLLQVDWGKVENTYPVPVKVKAYDRQGLMGDISTLFDSENVNIADINVNVSRSLAIINLVLEVKNLSQLSRVLTRIENLPNVLEAHRIKPG
jgi:GTP diphosphokinase / guanosine-3',5'-bis(diphosphate) 3'-diphosphatase